MELSSGTSLTRKSLLQIFTFLPYITTLMRKGFTAFDLLIALAIIAILLNVALFWYFNASGRQKVSADLQKVYFFLNEIQAEAKRKGCAFTIAVDNHTVNATVDSGPCTDKSLYLPNAAFNSTTLKVNSIGVFTNRGSVILDNTTRGEYNLVFDCITVSAFRICEGKVENGICVCKY